MNSKLSNGVTDAMVEAGARALFVCDIGPLKSERMWVKFAPEYLATSRACLNAALGETRVVVPREATKAMLDAAFNEPNGYWFHDVGMTRDDFLSELSCAYRAMIAAATAHKT